MHRKPSENSSQATILFFLSGIARFYMRNNFPQAAVPYDEIVEN